VLNRPFRLFGAFGTNGHPPAIVPKIQPVARTKNPKGETPMKHRLLKLSVMLQILKDENGQDLIEYALVVALIAFAATAGMSSVATAINTAFTNIGTKLTTYTS
jgi:pilus assembly protein Flp/PilA